MFNNNNNTKIKSPKTKEKLFLLFFQTEDNKKFKEKKVFIRKMYT